MDLQSVADRYRRLRLLGQGGAGNVWLVEDVLRPGAKLALKEPADDRPETAAALRREFAMLARLHHPGLVEARELDLSPATGLPRFTLELVEGEPLARVVATEGPDGLSGLAAEALRVLAFLHDFDLVHRDLAPANVLVRDRPRLGCRMVLLDLGLAAPGGARSGAAGTVPFVAPEVFEGGTADRRSDLYGLGAVLHDVVHGRPPYEPVGEDLSRLVERIRRGERERTSPPPGFPAGFASWIDDLLAADPTLRPASAREALARLNAACGSSHPMDTPTDRAARLASDPLPGRAAECRKLWSLLEPTASPSLVWITGAAGTGKGRLLRWLRSEAIEHGWYVVSSALGLLAAPHLEGLRLRAAREPVLLLLDDIETAGFDVSRFLDRVARELHGPPLRVAAAIRPGAAPHLLLRRLLEDADTVPTCHRLDLAPLDAHGVAAMVERAVGSRTLSDARLRWLADASEGNPLEVEALLVEGAWEKGGRGGKVTRPADRSIRSRFDLLSENGRKWLEALAILGSAVPDAAVARLAGLDPSAAREAVEEAHAAGLARTHDGRSSPQSRWVVDLVLDRVRDREVRRRAAELLVEIEGKDTDPWRLARLWSAAGDDERAEADAVRAAEAAERGGDPAGAAERWAWALSHHRQLDADRLRFRRRQAEALSATGRHQAAARALGAALRLCRTKSERADLLALQALALVQAGRFVRARVAAGEARALARGPTERRQRAQALRAVALVEARLGNEAEAIGLFEEALALFREEGELAGEAEARQNLAACKARLLRPGAEEDYASAIELYRKLEHHAGELRSRIGLAVMQFRAGRLEPASRVLDEVRRKASERGHLDLHETALSWLSVVALAQGRFDRALAYGQEALDQARHLGDHNRVLVDQCRFAEALTGAGRPGQAADLLREALAAPLDRVEPNSLDAARMLLASALLDTPGGDETVADELLARCQDGFRGRRRTRDLLLALVLDMDRRSRPGSSRPFDPVDAEYRALAAATSEIDGEIRLRAAIARAQRLLGLGDLAAAEVEARAATDLAREVPAPALAPRAQELAARILEGLGRREEAEHARRRGAELLDGVARLIEDEAVRQSFLDQPAFRPLRTPAADDALDRRLLALYEMIRTLNSESDPDALLESILDMAIGAVTAERGMILLLDQATGELAVRIARNVERETERDVVSYSRRIVTQAGLGRSVLALDAGSDERFRDLASVSLYGIRSLMCVPLRSHGKIVGTVYLDRRHEGRLFTREDLRFVEAFADHAALALENVRQRAHLETENRRLQAVAEERASFGNLVGRSPAMQQVYRLIEKVAASELPVLIHGESGTGKELVARSIHFHSRRRRKVFLTENCAAIPESLLESELFGHVRGAFTGADRDRAGLFEQAHGGTLFLDEVGDMSAAMQARLLRALQEGEVRRVGGDRTLRVDVRVLAATHRDLAREVEHGRFREDLLYRLQVLAIRIPPLRDRPADIPLLIDHLLARIARERGRPAPVIDTAVREMLARHSWPGNVRQVENTLQRLTLFAGDRPITAVDLEADELSRTIAEGGSGRSRFSLDDGVRDQLRRALEASGGNRDRAARLLGISRATIYRKIKDLGL